MAHLNLYIRNIIFKLWVLLSIFVLLLAHRASFIRGLKLNMPSSPAWAKTLPAFVVLCVLIRMAFDRNPIAPNLPLNSVFADAAIIGNVVTVIAVILCAPVIEEIFFRGFVYPTVNRICGMHVAVFFTAALFTLAHFKQFDNKLFIAILFGLSLIFTVARAATKSTLLPIILHVIYNFIYVAVGFLRFFILRY
jgi:membrane protease YdiL (CAAX protease family)